MITRFDNDDDDEFLDTLNPSSIYPPTQQRTLSQELYLMAHPLSPHRFTTASMVDVVSLKNNSGCFYIIFTTLIINNILLLFSMNQRPFNF